MAEDYTLYAHRGTNPYVDNSIDAYKWGFNYGADYAETDFRLTKDGVVVSYHDDLSGGIANLTYAQVKAQVPTIVTLGELIELSKSMEIETGRKLGILIENKAADQATAEAIIQTLVAHDYADPERIVFQSFGGELPYVRETLMPRYGVEFPLVQLTGERLTDANIAYWKTYADGVAPQMVNITAESVAAAHAAGLTVNGWTVDGTEADVRNAISLGVDGIINDITQLARPALEKLVNGATVAYGTEQWEALNGTAGADVVYGMQGDDLIRGGAGDDVIYGDAGDDVLFGGEGNDSLIGGSGDDFLAGGAGADTLEGCAGNDVIVATGDTVVVRAGSGIDLVVADEASTLVFRDAASDAVTVLRDGDNLILRAGDDAVVLRNGAAILPASVTFADGVTLTGTALLALAVEGTDAAVTAALPKLEYTLAHALPLAEASTVALGTDLATETDFGDGIPAKAFADAEAGATYRLAFTLADLPAGEDGVRVLWGGEVVYEGTPSAAVDALSFLVVGGAGDGSNALVFQGAGTDPAAFGAALDDVHVVKVVDPVLSRPDNTAPVAADASALLSRDLPFSSTVAATDANGDALVYGLGAGPASGTLVFNPDGSYTYTPRDGFSGADSFSYVVSDGHGGATEAVVTLNVFDGILIGTDLVVNGGFEDTSGSSNKGSWGYENHNGVILGWTEANGDRIEQHASGTPANISAREGSYWLDLDGYLAQTGTHIVQNVAHVEAGATYRLNFSIAENDSVAAMADDGIRVVWNGEIVYEGNTKNGWTDLSIEVEGGAGDGSNRLEFIGTGTNWNNDGAAIDNVSLVKIADVGAALPANQAPEAQDGNADVLKDAAITGKLSATDADAGASLIYSLDTGPANGSVLLYADGSYSYTPKTGFAGTDSFTFKVSDGRGGVDTAAMTFTVAAPTVAIGTDLIVNGSFEDLSESGNYNGGSDWGYRNNDKAIVGWTNVNRIEQHLDNYGGVVAKDGAIWIDLDSSGLGQRNKLGQNIAQVETGATYQLTFSLSDSDTVRDDDGVIVIWNGEVIFDGLPPQTSASWTTYTFEVVGGSGNGSNRLEFSDTGVADSWGAGAALDDVHFVKIADVPNTAPLAADDTGFSTGFGAALTIAAADLLGNDSDADGDTLVIQSAGDAVGGTVALDETGAIVFTPDAGALGKASFSYTVSDGHGGTSTATVALTIGADSEDDFLFGTDGRDTLIGTDADEILFSSGGDNDRMTGGAGADVFFFGDAALDGTRARTTITDYEAGIDAIVLGEGVSLAALHQVGATVVAYLDDPSGADDIIYIRGADVTVENVSIYEHGLLLV